MTDFGVSARANDVIVQSDQKIVALGRAIQTDSDFALARYNPDGSLDTTFSNDGMVTTDFAGLGDDAFEIALQNDGKVVAIGYTFNGIDRDFALARYNTDGSLDNKVLLIATPVFSGCQTCTIETEFIIQGGALNKISIFGWYVNKRDNIELLIKEPNDKIILKQRVNGRVINKSKGLIPLGPNTPYKLEMSFNGTNFTISINGTQLISMTPVGNIAC